MSYIFAVRRTVEPQTVLEEIVKFWGLAGKFDMAHSWTCMGVGRKL